MSNESDTKLNQYMQYSEAISTHRHDKRKSDMIGYRCNDVEVIEEVKGVKDRWMCRCKCGLIMDIRGYSLRHPKSVNSYKCNHIKDGKQKNANADRIIEPDVVADFRGTLRTLCGDKLRERRLDQWNTEFMIEGNGKIVISFELTAGNKGITSDAKQKRTLAYAKQGIHHIQIYEHEWLDTDLRNKIIVFMQRMLVPEILSVQYARNTDVREISNNEAKEFCNSNHLQGGINSTINIGLFTSSNELISVMSFGNPRYDNGHEWELLRYCVKNGVAVVGGAEKLFKHFLRLHNPSSVITYSDISKFTGNIYTKLGFKVMSEPFTSPGYVWVKGSKALKRYQTQKHKLVEQGFGTPDQTENEIMENNGYTKVYNSGNIRLEWRA